MFPIDNYVKIGWGRNQVFIFFSTHDPNALAKIRQGVDAATRDFWTMSHVAVWKPVTGLAYPPVGASVRGSC